MVAYAFSPIDLIPDFIPVLGYLDDLILVPLGISAAIKMIPPDVLAECRAKAQIEMDKEQTGQLGCGCRDRIDLGNWYYYWCLGGCAGFGR